MPATQGSCPHERMGVDAAVVQREYCEAAPTRNGRLNELVERPEAESAPERGAGSATVSGPLRLPVRVDLEGYPVGQGRR